ncbi:branched-chain amino acid ABC transporter permease/ATP-binding protein [Cryptosporangium aurantiacum]|uniref:ABC-type branched-chain amino acid transport system, ATPase component n=1 Tax=Cryptosporangium aurantiacum TaxID=134849 RepID=A0A1M7RG45_9ACTN|nr:branched-chain amino acid ABC transporter permease/ATP-binding protein [Cryptosporangium aurantiacum]SHN45253.1 ABC-type branched-chain amino acid transport system, ATPase component [Cryptosporangium aurantiacum]
MSHLAALLLGLGNGAVFAALALALVLTFRSSGVINFATGAVALTVAYVYAGLRDGELLVLVVPGLPPTVDIGQPWGLMPAVVLALLVGAGLGALLYAAVFRPLRAAPPLAQAVASLGVLVVIQALLAIRLGGAPVSVEAIFPASRWELGSLTVLSDRFWLAVSVLVLTVVLTLAFRYTRFGLLTRATAETRLGAYLSGVSTDRVALANWMLSATVAGAAGILIAPLTPLTPGTYTLFIVPALAAAVVGGFQHLVPTVLAGLAIGMLQSEALTLAAEHSWMPQAGSAALIPLAVILVALLYTRRGIPARGQLLRQRLGRAGRPRGLVVPTVAGTALGVVALVFTEGTWRSAVIATFILAVIGLSLVVVTGYAGQVSLAQLALAGTAAFVLSALSDLPFPIAPLLAAAVATVVGVVVGLPALRLRGLSLGIVTLALAYAIEAAWFRNTDLVGTSGARVTQPTLFGLDLSVGTGEEFPRLPFGLLCLFVLVVTAWGVAKLRMSGLGSAMLAVRANERSAAGIGVDVVRVKILAFGLASFIAGIGGCLLAYRQSVVTFDSFTTLAGLALLSTAYLAGITSVYGGVLAGVMAAGGITAIAMDRWVHLGDWYQVVSGLGLIAVLLTNPEGLAGGGHDLVERVRRRFGRRRAAAPAATSDAGLGAARGAGLGAVGPGGGPRLEVSGLTVRYGGVTAVEDFAIRVASGEVVGLIGPNGAGKTSVIDALTGFARASGTVRLDGTSIDGLAPHVRARRGLGRTFQALELHDDLTVEENVGIAVHSGSRSAAVAEALDVVGIGHLADRVAEDLSQGERQLVSLARACAARPRVVLLDEPAAGLDSTESRRLGERIRAIARDSGAGVLLVDHDVSLVLDVCDRVYVLDFGHTIAAGTPEEIRADRAVVAAYLGRVHEAVAE